MTNHKYRNRIFPNMKEQRRLFIFVMLFINIFSFFIVCTASSTVNSDVFAQDTSHHVDTLGIIAPVGEASDSSITIYHNASEYETFEQNKQFEIVFQIYLASDTNYLVTINNTIFNSGKILTDNQNITQYFQFNQIGLYQIQFDIYLNESLDELLASSYLININIIAPLPSDSSDQSSILNIALEYGSYLLATLIGGGLFAKFLTRNSKKPNFKSKKISKALLQPSFQKMIATDTFVPPREVQEVLKNITKLSGMAAININSIEPKEVYSNIPTL